MDEPKTTALPVDAPAAASYNWEALEGRAGVHIDFDVIDRLSNDVMRGFGAVPRRGAEVGGILLGAIEFGGRPSIRIEDYVPIPCVHLHGPSFVLAEADIAAFDAAMSRWAPGPDRRIYAVGFYRSNTRPEMRLDENDVALLDHRFPGRDAVCLLIQPFATRASEAAFLLRENGKFSTQPVAALFPFSRKLLGGGSPRRRARGDRENPLTNIDLSPLTEPLAPEPIPISKYRGGWMWIPLSFIFLLLGVVVGFQVANSYQAAQAPIHVQDPFALNLSVIEFGNELHLKWDADAPAFRTAQRGVLQIVDGATTKTVQLEKDDLSRGGALYPHASNLIKFRMEVFPQDRVSVAESLEVRLPEPVK